MDADGDGFTPGQGDCDDAEPTIILVLETFGTMVSMPTVMVQVTMTKTVMATILTNMVV